MYQKTTIVGNLGSDPDMRYMPDGTAVTNFSVATNRRWTDKATGEPVDETTWFRVSVWGRQAEPCNEYLAKGRKVLVEGHLKSDKATGGPKLWTAQDGSVRASFEIRANAVRFLSSRDEDAGAASSSTSSSQAPTAPQEEDDIPF